MAERMGQCLCRNPAEDLGHHTSDMDKLTLAENGHTNSSAARLGGPTLQARYHAWQCTTSAPWSGSMRIAVQVEAVAGPGAQVAGGPKPGRQRVAVAAAGGGPPTQIPKNAKPASTLQMLGGHAHIPATDLRTHVYGRMSTVTCLQTHVCSCINGGCQTSLGSKASLD